ncbi:hypothetical protein [Marinithermus hydrothermalis]|uniref:Uncharacterized protein n=1 Tax=Marinithermus hydrothermalis (strain DSM 14884 / JCM 11576 / T1) TaxID=869210 RepID=F2NLV5_MARHT|nr:hypothetical protein [Marinithermus hydrothermalis]AEB11212.1 hypothetical protein Marky_0460 [Marinithermus hydrothermalis DSM 14884]
MRILLFLAVLLGGVYWYAENYGLALGYPPFTPVWYWNYTGESVYRVRVSGVTDAVKVKLRGELQEGRLEVRVNREGERRVVASLTLRGRFDRVLTQRVNAGMYEVHLRVTNARGYAFLDWVSTKFNP